ncbi:cyclase family protein [Rhodococcus sp. T7]|uniref:cyclase family protein n=1 Tax=Rhodococcus sp. T7 TaxID=627444 RepID=UPI0013C9F1ED|nr:cyclase family protein [Rhodococcus sp. T7]KAF0957188.1 Kynurenine formamidase [Rhodococcus sp. T7]KAF0959026.1 Kynurenine formamidase [Rhodococcus sp. T7]
MGTESNWGRWGLDDEIGALNLVDASTTLAALRAAETGQVLSLAQPAGPGAGVPPHRNKSARYMDRNAGDYALGARSPDGFRFAEDTVTLSTHSGTHVDALSHAWSGEELYNAHSAANVRSTAGAKRLGAEKLRPVVTRGVLIDLVEAHGAPLDPSTPIDAEHLIAGYEMAAVEPSAGDAVLIRTGWWERSHGNEYFDLEPGLSLDGAQWLVAHDVALVGADNYAVEVQPSPAGTTFPVHLHLLHRHGVPLIENLALAELAASGRKVFVFVFAPIPLQGSTGSPVTPLAIL